MAFESILTERGDAPRSYSSQVTGVLEPIGPVVDSLQRRRAVASGRGYALDVSSGESSRLKRYWTALRTMKQIDNVVSACVREAKFGTRDVYLAEER